MVGECRLHRAFRQAAKILLIGFWLTLLLTIFGLKIFAPDIYRYFTQEDSLGEYAQAASPSSAFALSIAVRNWGE